MPIEGCEKRKIQSLRTMRGYASNARARQRMNASDVAPPAHLKRLVEMQQASVPQRVRQGL